ncbi:MAG: hypothetical protein AAGF58_05820 [Pseudomonadota bacterium]
MTVSSREPQEPDLTIIVDRSDTSIEMFMKASASDYIHLLGTQFDGFVKPDGTVDYQTIREKGSFDIADKMFERVGTTVGRQSLDFESMSMMVHPPRLKFPLETPLDGLLATSVCTTDPPQGPVSLDDM